MTSRFVLYDFDGQLIRWSWQPFMGAIEEKMPRKPKPPVIDWNNYEPAPF